MAQFPDAEADISTLATSMMAGYTLHAADFPRLEEEKIMCKKVMWT